MVNSIVLPQAAKKPPYPPQNFLKSKTSLGRQIPVRRFLEFPDGANVLYDYVNDKQITLPKTWTDFQFSANESQIAFKDLENS